MWSLKCSLCLLLWCCVLGWSQCQNSRPEFKQVEELPADIPTCSQADANLNDCIKEAFQQMMPRLKNGIPELNVPPLDPFVMEKTSFQYSSDLMQGRAALKNVRAYGLSAAVIEKVDFELSDGKVRMGVVTHVPSMLIEGNYKADMKFNEVKMTPKGYFNVSMTDVTMRARPEGELYERDGHSYLRLTKFDAEPDVGDMHIYASGLVPDPTLNQIVLDFANQYWRPMLKSMLPETRATWEPLVLDAMNEFLAHLPIDLILTKA